MLYSHHQKRVAKLSPSAPTDNLSSPWQNASFPSSPSPHSNASIALQPNTSWPSGPAYQAGQSKAGNVNSLVESSIVSREFQTSIANSNAFGAATNRMTAKSVKAEGLEAWNQPGMTPDFARAQTLVFPGDAYGPDLTANPMGFVPTIDLSSLFRFDVSKSWVTSRWDRISTSPAQDGLHGMRVALVTGTNSWDLHGALTYFFDANHRVQRITYRGWTGDASRLLQVMQQQHGLRPHPTHWAGLYLSQRSGLMMKHPTVIDKSNPVQQLALVLEINNPAGNTPLSSDFQSLLPAAMANK